MLVVTAQPVAVSREDRIVPCPTGRLGCEVINIRDGNPNQGPTGDTGSQSGPDADFDGNGPPETPYTNAVPLPPKRRLRRNLLLLLFVGAALYFFLPRWAVMQQALTVLSHLSIPFVALAVAAQVLSYLGSGYLLRSVVRASPRPISVLHGALVTLAANSIGTLGGGAPGTAAMTYLWLRRHGVNRGAAGLGGWIPIFLNLGGLAVVSLGGLFVLIHLKKSSTVLALGLGLVMLILLGGLGTLVWLRTHRHKLHGVAAAIAKFAAKLRRKPVHPPKIEVAVEQLLEGWDALVQGGWRRPVLGAIVNTGGDMLTLGFLFLAAGNHLSGALLLAGYGVPQLIGKLTVILGGAGVVETSMIALYVILGVPKPAAIVAVLGYRLFSFWLPTVIGLGLVPFLGARDRQIESTDAPYT
jgi:glycosyltransferase 2 family protein